MRFLLDIQGIPRDRNGVNQSAILVIYIHSDTITAIVHLVLAIAHGIRDIRDTLIVFRVRRDFPVHGALAVLKFAALAGLARGGELDRMIHGMRGGIIVRISIRAIKSRHGYGVARRGRRTVLAL